MNTNGALAPALTNTIKLYKALNKAVVGGKNGEERRWA